MANLDQEESLRIIADSIAEILPKIYGQEMGFFLCVTPLNEKDGIADYIANCVREDGIEWLRETADRLENNEEIGAIEGQA